MAYGLAQLAGQRPGSGREFAVAPGPLAGVGTLVDSGVDGVMVPQGFALRAVARYLTNPVTGWLDPLSLTGYHWHTAPDGGACFAADDGGWVYVSNSESASRGGAGTLRFDASGNIIDSYRILDDTRRNCAGGCTPWQTWLSCEETEDGIVYECNPFGTPDQAQAKPALGRFAHEAVGVDLATRTVFMTEDCGDGRLYRFVADPSDLILDSRGRPRLKLESGRLQAMTIVGYEDGGYAVEDAALRLPHRVSWADVGTPELCQSSVRATLASTGSPVPGTLFKGGEGIWLYELPTEARRVPPGGSRPTRALLFFASKGDNRLFAYDVDNELIESVFDNSAIDPPFDQVDSVVVSPAGDILVGEDGDAMRLMVVVPNQPAKVLIKVTLGSSSEITGPAFSPDGSRLYFSSQRGPNLGVGIRKRGKGVTYELAIPPLYRKRI
ncbi:MAG: alkaline phosphatase PhoX [Porticoccaceae bacterium]